MGAIAICMADTATAIVTATATTTVSVIVTTTAIVTAIVTATATVTVSMTKKRMRRYTVWRGLRGWKSELVQLMVLSDFSHIYS